RGAPDRAGSAVLELEDLLEVRPVRRREPRRQQARHEAGRARRPAPARRVIAAEVGGELGGARIDRVPERGPAGVEVAVAAVAQVVLALDLLAELRPQVLVDVGLAGEAAEGADGVAVVEQCT